MKIKKTKKLKKLIKKIRKSEERTERLFDRYNEAEERTEILKQEYQKKFGRLAAGLTGDGEIDDIISGAAQITDPMEKFTQSLQRYLDSLPVKPNVLDAEELEEKE